MKNLSTWLLVFFAAIFWFFRIIVAVTYEMNIDFGGIEPFNQTMEIILLFVVLICMLFIIKRKMIGALIYLLVYGLYFGSSLTTGLTTLFTSNTINLDNTEMYLNTFVSLIGIIIPVAVLFDLLLDKNRKANPHNKKTDWFYGNEKFDRQMDERADKNNYKTL